MGLESGNGRMEDYGSLAANNNADTEDRKDGICTHTKKDSKALNIKIVDIPHYDRL